MGVQQKVSSDEAKEVAQLRSYLMANSFGLRDYRLEVDGDGLRGLGAMESNIDKLIANRMKKRGMSWTIKGAQRMSRLISLREMGKLHSWITHKDKVDTQPPREGIRKKISGPGKDDGEWLKVGLPALHGPHQNRPWAQSLRALTHEVGGLT
jgi:hypothetical protein